VVLKGSESIVYDVMVSDFLSLIVLADLMADKHNDCTFTKTNTKTTTVVLLYTVSDNTIVLGIN